MKALSKRIKATEFNSVPNRPHGVKVKLDIVDGIERRRGHFAGQKEVPQVGPRTRAAGVATAGLVGWAIVLGVRRVLDVQLAGAGEQLPVTRVARRHDAVE